MKLNYDCVRDVLLYLEKNLNFKNDVLFKKSFSTPDLKYSHEDIIYTVLKLTEADFLFTSRRKPRYDALLPYPPDVKVFDITYAGHEFLNTIRDNKIWNNVKKSLSTLTSYSFKILIDIASNIAIQKALSNLSQ